MAAHIPTTPSGVNASGLSGFSLMHGAVPVPTPLLTAETVALLDAIPPATRTADDLLDEISREIGRQELAARRAQPRHQACVRPDQRRLSVQARIRS